MKDMPHVFEYPEGVAGTWSSFFGNNNPVVLEVGCGTGSYTIGLAEMHPNKNYIGLDIKGARMWHGATHVKNTGLKNAAFIRTQMESIDKYFAPGEVDEIWITFPDPQPRPSKENKRLPGQRFLNLYTQFLKPGGIIHLKTDNADLFEFAVEIAGQNNTEILKITRDLYSEDWVTDELSIKTVFETKFLAMGIPIKYISYKIFPKH